MSLFEAETREEFISAFFPTGAPVSDTKEFLQNSPIDWIVSRGRLLDSAILNGNESQIKLMVNEYAYRVGIVKAVEYFLARYERLVTLAMEQDVNIFGEDA